MGVARHDGGPEEAHQSGLDGPGPEPGAEVVQQRTVAVQQQRAVAVQQRAVAVKVLLHLLPQADS